METKICVVGLGYVGLPLAVEFSKNFSVIGFDISKKKIDDFKKGIDPTNEVGKEELSKAKIEYTADPKKIKEANFIIIAVPTPIDNEKKPDLTFLESASEVVGKNLAKDSIIVYESTVYPGATEETCVPVLEKTSGLKYGTDFKVGYSPERVNPGDKEHTVDKIVKVVGGMDIETTDKIAEVYATIIKAGIHKVSSIKVAEAAKVIENIQRDLNIALMNELSLIFDKVGINTKEVIEAAATKWNFHKYYPGLVGGHCIGIDPFYLTYKAEQLGYNPKVILAGRNINDSMAANVADRIIKLLTNAGKILKDCTVLIMGLTFKENVPDMRNSKAKDIIKALKQYNLNVIGCEPLLEPGIVNNEFKVENKEFKNIADVDCVVMFNIHDAFKDLTLDNLREKTKNKPVLIDIKNFFNKKEAEQKGFLYWSL